MRVLIASVGAVVLVGAGVGVYLALDRNTQNPVETIQSVAPKTLAIKPNRVPLPLPELKFQNHVGKALTLADFKGKAVLLNIWATWCSPCRKEMPTLDRLQAKLGGPHFEVVALSIDRGGPDVAQNFFKQIGVQKLSLYIDPSGAVYGIPGIVGLPTTLLIDREGRELWRYVGPAEWDAPDAIETIRKYLGDSSPS